MKKLFSSFVVVMLFSLAACAQNSNQNTSQNTSQSASASAAVTSSDTKSALDSKPSLDKTWWLRIKMAELKSYPVANPPKSIVRTTHEGKTVYYISAACCDRPSELYDDEGKLLCYPGGGFAGGDGRCKSFVLGSAPVVPVWQDDRPPKPAAKPAVQLKEN